MRYVVLSFDDGRKDFYPNALPILRKYGLPATLNVIPAYVGRRDLPEFDSGDHECMSWAEIRRCRECAVEIAGHGADHTNDVEGIRQGQKLIAEALGVPGPLGFASPFSEICARNLPAYRGLLADGTVKYIRSGNQLRRDGWLYALLYLGYRYTKSRLLYRWYNRRNILRPGQRDLPLFLSVTCNRENTAEQVIRFVQKLPEGTGAILMFHSILRETDPGFGRDKWYNTVRDFDALCAFLASETTVTVVTNAELCDLLA